jgi:hypothetical protein
LIDGPSIKRPYDGTPDTTFDATLLGCLEKQRVSEKAVAEVLASVSQSFSRILGGAVSFSDIGWFF